MLRSILLRGSESRWLRDKASHYPFVRRAVARFMPGEDVADALSAARGLREKGLGAVLTRLGENVTDPAEADEVTAHYQEVLERAKAEPSDCEISVKLTQLGLDLDQDGCYARLKTLIERARALGNFVWIDMEQTRYTEATLELARRARGENPNVGVCLQAYLHRTAADLASLLSTGIGVRLVKGAYNEPASAAFPRKNDVDANFLTLARQLLEDGARRAGGRAVFGTHDGRLIQAIRAHAAAAGLAPRACEFHLLYGIQRALQERLAGEGAMVRVLISYGSHWFPWYMRRLAERPANVFFVAKSLFAR